MKQSLPNDFAFQATVESHGWYHLAPFRWNGRVLTRAETLPEGTVDLAITATKRALDVKGADDSPELRKRIRRMFQLDLDLAEFHERARTSEPHAWAADERFGRLLCGSTLFEDAVKIIHTTNTMWRQTVRMTELLVEKCGRRSPDGRAAFPLPSEVARFSPDELQTDCRLGYRAKLVHALATGIADGSIELDAIADPSQTTEQLFKSYRKLPGIGPYGAAHLLAMDGRHDFIAVDTEFRRFVRERYHGGRRISDKAMLRRYSKWGRWKYLAYWSELWGSVAEALQPRADGDS
jgi:3-methyladenine DNA glycosylase/8-oxoguanine DNA glycosylase